jgi:hypothetical protein
MKSKSTKQRDFGFKKNFHRDHETKPDKNRIKWEARILRRRTLGSGMQIKVCLIGVLIEVSGSKTVNNIKRSNQRKPYNTTDWEVMRTSDYHIY